MCRDRVRISKLLSYVLRHKPDHAGVTLDAQGYADVDRLLAGLQRRGVHMTRGQLVEIVASNEKQRFAFSEDGGRIRASQGHSIPVDLDYAPQKPPPVLYHGTATRFLAAIHTEGLKRRARHHVHLSGTRETALQVGSRHGNPIVLEIDAGQMYADGHEFFLSANGIWLTDHVPREYLRFEEGT